MTEEEIKTLRSLRDKGYAICIFNPDELGQAPTEEVETACAEAGWRQIDWENLPRNTP